MKQAPIYFLCAVPLLLTVQAPPRAHGTESPSNPPTAIKPGTGQQTLKNFEKVKDNWLKSEKKSRDIMASLFQSQKDMKKIVEERGSLKQQMLQLDLMAKDLAREILDLKKQVEEKRKQLLVRIRLFNRWSEGGAARFLVSSEDAGDLYRRLRMISFMAKHDLELGKDYLRAQIELEEKNLRFLARLHQLKAMQAKLLEKEKSLALESSKKKVALENLKSSNQNNLNALQAYRSTGLIDPLISPSMIEKKGQLPWPVQSSPTQTFRLIKDPIHQVILPHRGWYFETASATPVKSIFDGQVRYVGQIGDLGRVIILDHGDHFYSVYAGLSEIAVKPGQELKASHKLAMTGNLPLHKSQGLYFEMRHFSEPEDPQFWLQERTQL